MSKLIDSYCSTAAFRLISSWTTTLWDTQQVPFTWRPSCFSPVPALFFPSIGRKTIVTSESKVQRHFTAVCHWWGAHWEPSAAALWSRLAQWMDSAACHLLQAIMIIRVWSRAWLYSGTTGGSPHRLLGVYVRGCICECFYRTGK